MLIGAKLSLLITLVHCSVLYHNYPGETLASMETFPLLLHLYRVLSITSGVLIKSILLRTINKTRCNNIHVENFRYKSLTQFY
jgi:hypothetical protein